MYRAGNVEGRGGGVHDLVGGPTGRAPPEWSALLRLTKGTSLKHPSELFGGNLDELVRQLAKISGDGVERGARYGDEDPSSRPFHERDKRQCPGRTGEPCDDIRRATVISIGNKCSAPADQTGVVDEQDSHRSDGI